MSSPGEPTAAPPSGRRRWLVWMVAGWIVVISVLAWWSVRHDPATVPEQRDIAQALPVLEQATGAIMAAASGEGRVVRLGELELSHDCTVTPVRGGVVASRDVTVYVPVDQALGVLQEVAAKLPAGYRAAAGSSSGGRRVGLHADAGQFVSIDVAADSETQEFQIAASTGCRPATGELRPSDPATTTDLPASMRAALTAVGARPGEAAETTVGCPDGGTAATYTVLDVPAPRDLGSSLQQTIEGAQIARAEPAGWAYRTGTDSVVIEKDGSTLRVSVTTACA